MADTPTHGGNGGNASGERELVDFTFPNEQTFVGNLTRDPEIHVFQSGKSIGKTSLALNERKYNRETGQYEDGRTMFLEVICFESILNNVLESLHKGDRVLVLGKLRIREYLRKDAAGQPTGQTGTAYEVTVNDIAPSLKWAQAVVTKVRREKVSRGAPVGDESDYDF